MKIEIIPIRKSKRKNSVPYKITKPPNIEKIEGVLEEGLEEYGQDDIFQEEGKKEVRLILYVHRYMYIYVCRYMYIYAYTCICMYIDTCICM
jgi:hypothetical protein